jgi:hypothetical protein
MGLALITATGAAAQATEADKADATRNKMESRETHDRIIKQFLLL